MAKNRAKFSGICEVNFYNDFTDEYLDGVLITLNGNNYIAYTDPTDGWRSYGCFRKDNSIEQKNKFPEQEVIVDWDYSDGGDVNGVIIYNLDNEIILKVCTEHHTAWYPCAIFEYKPQNLPINKKREQGKFSLDNYMKNPYRYRIYYKGKEVDNLLKYKLFEIQNLISDLEMVEKVIS